ncbi:hypothetical protein GUITHDRAFT_116704 [Guillardia theta CCMP2712]|uniref:RWP-RK domain-containing protein n=1 Tax=Guillardia theta (strain CCMP2712) TaxID=905079 RepID=L1IMT6_GUITC|nr:hypothetical protein GUITHDRAFT_116704 [Guillardia theta CCMP2712]EKX37125.1 hypothetical protein GUITHDRAFT_116704 [Guillardia theta CCMP2712]|eukprot:XP_005824105.1 hypothetical protein GUITHDRAFT_116704 [Guillardia theta CCMP2712]
MTDTTTTNVRVFPRRKPLQHLMVHQRRRGQGVNVEYSTLARLFHLPQTHAASSLQLSLTAFKSACRRLGIPRWPYERKSRQDKAAEEVRSKRKQAQAAVAIRWEDEEVAALDPTWIDWFISASESAGLE